MYEYRGTAKRVVDGDTVDVDVDLGFSVHSLQRVRLAGINAPEPRGPERHAGQLAADYLASILRIGTPVILVTEKERGKYGRYIAELYLLNGRGERGVLVNDRMVELGYAVRKQY